MLLWTRTRLKFILTFFLKLVQELYSSLRTRTSALIQAHVRAYKKCPIPPPLPSSPPHGFPRCRFFFVLCGRGRGTGQTCYERSISTVSFCVVLCWEGGGAMRGMYFDAHVIERSFLCRLLLLLRRFTRTRPIWKATRLRRVACGPSTTSS